MVQGFGDLLQAPQTLFQTYFEQLQQAVKLDLGPNAPQRLGHLILIKKYQDRLGLTADFDGATWAQIEHLLKAVKERNWALDFNTAGLYKVDCNDFYPGWEIAAQAKQMGIELCFGSDAHATNEVGRAWHLFEKFSQRVSGTIPCQVDTYKNENTVFLIP